ncbi:DDE-type integrase/transposase/recombinase [Tropicimonas marinistellae]|uniref:DDE-type integrase/transposase/recombinase n=1 Tax=Tropicimonas marinistellae TaxID=1739787 RepID=UPI001F39EEA0|nr:DDE-type integrase/transposase/recombinase [Tropicimonas marinistellae]
MRRFWVSRHNLWSAVDHENAVLKSCVTKVRDRKSAVNFTKKRLCRYGRPRSRVTAPLRRRGVALKAIAASARRQSGRRLNNRAEISHLHSW